MNEQQYNQQNNANQNSNANQYVQNQPYYVVQQSVTEENLPEEFRPIKSWGYFGYSLLFSIPIIGLICNLIFCFSDSNINRRNFARSRWCGLIIAVALFLLVVVLFLAFGISLETIPRIVNRLVEEEQLWQC